MKLMVFILMILMVSPSFAKGFNKCVIDGKVVYTHKNCPEKQNRAAFGKGTFSGLNTEGMANTYNYEALQRRAQELRNQGLHQQAAQYQKKADIVSKGGRFRENKQGQIEVLTRSTPPKPQKLGPKIVPLTELDAEAPSDVPREPIKTAGDVETEVESDLKPPSVPSNAQQQVQTTEAGPGETEL